MDAHENTYGFRGWPSFDRDRPVNTRLSKLLLLLLLTAVVRDCLCVDVLFNAAAVLGEAEEEAESSEVDAFAATSSPTLPTGLGKSTPVSEQLDSHHCRECICEHATRGPPAG